MLSSRYIHLFTSVRALLVPAIAFMFVLAAQQWTWLTLYPQDWTIPVAQAINAVLNWIIPFFHPLASGISVGLGALLNFLVLALQYAPWSAIALTVMLIAFHAGGFRLLGICFVAVSYMVASGFWRQSMATVALVLLAVPISILCGFALGVGAFLVKPLRRPVEILFDFMQTFPVFAYLLPLLLLFGFGPVAGLIATAIYAIPPMARCVLEGLDQVPRERIEVGDMAGCTRSQRLLWVELPAAKQLIMVGINQSTMAALSMVITASIIGGFDDIGWAVLNGLRQADLSKSLLSGLVIVFISIIVDRITASLFIGSPKKRLQNGFPRFRWIALTAFLILLLGSCFRFIAPNFTQSFNATSGVIDFGLLNQALLGFVARYSDVLDAIKNVVLYYLVLPLRVGLVGAALPSTWGFTMTPTITSVYAGAALIIAAFQIVKGKPGTAAAALSTALFFYLGAIGFPWPAAVLIATWASWRASGPKLAIFTAASLFFVLVTGLWVPFMKSLYLVGVSVVLCIAVGGILGACAARYDWFSAFLRPVNDALQTMPQFVFLIPAIMFFKVGEFAGLIAISIYAVVPAIRYTEAGLRNVSPSIMETARQIGCTPTQSSLFVQIPLARSALLLGLNQTIMAAISMLPIAATVGTSELGQQIYIALGKADAGMGITAGIVFCLTAINLDRMLHSAASRLRTA